MPFTAATGSWMLRGLSYNDSIKVGAPQTFGFCTWSAWIRTQ